MMIPFSSPLICPFLTMSMTCAGYVRDTAHVASTGSTMFDSFRIDVL
jgi:hypothetical protein